MPLFSNKFIAKAIPARKIPGPSDQTGGDYKINLNDHVSVDLGNFKAYFHDGHWMADGGKPEHGLENQLMLGEKLKIAKEEINMLKLKEEIIIDMMTDLTIQLAEKSKRDKI